MSDLECWNCKSTASLDAISENDGDCPQCNAEIDMHYEVKRLQQQLAESQASNERLREGLNNITQDYYAEVQAKYSDDDLKYPSMQKSKDSDMTFINEAMDLLRETPKQSLAHIKADAVYEFAEEMDKERAEASDGDWMRNDEEQFYHECFMEAEKYADQLREGE